jgi:hypothetical protein
MDKKIVEMVKAIETKQISVANDLLGEVIKEKVEARYNKFNKEIDIKELL